MSNIIFDYSGDFSLTHQNKDVRVTLKNVDEMHIDELLYEFQLFLNSVGYVLNGNIEVVPENEDFMPETEIEWDNRPEAAFGNFRFVTTSGENC